MFALQRKEAIAKANITHVLSVLRIELKESLFKDFHEHHVVAVDDTDDEDLLQHFPATNAFILRGLSLGGAVYVHCAMGISRSATVLTAYLMKTRKLSAEDALETVRAARPLVCPNLSFRKQLKLYEEMGCPDAVQEHPKYQRWLFKNQVEMSNMIGRAPDQIRFCDQEKEVARVQGLEEGSSENVELELRCKRCRQTLATSHALAPHTAVLSLARDSNPQVCAHHFLEPLLWMKPEMSKGAVSGKLKCPKCDSKVGSYAWQGIQCSCGSWVVPGISVAKGKVDEVKVSRL
ncbi:protein-tyrosine phosphatase-like protein [Tirmania nivea]|nr:protein-tyrosine phosphatase-like protein [Tirmania nivea]